MARRPTFLSWAPHILCIAQEVHSGPIRGKSEQQPELPLLGATSGSFTAESYVSVVADSSALSCPREVCGTGEGRPLKDIDTLRDPTFLESTIDLYGPSTDAQAFSPQSPSSLKLLSLQCLLKRPATAALFSSPGSTQALGCCFVVTLTLHRAHSTPLADQRALMGPRTLTTYTRHLYLPSGDKGSITSISFFLTSIQRPIQIFFLIMWFDCL